MLWKIVSPFPAGDYKTASNRQGSMTIKHETQRKRIHKINTALGRSVNYWKGFLPYMDIAAILVMWT